MFFFSRCVFRMGMFSRMKISNDSQLFGILGMQHFRRRTQKESDVIFKVVGELLDNVTEGKFL